MQRGIKGRKGEKRGERGIKGRKGTNALLLTVGTDPHVCPRNLGVYACRLFVVVRADTGVCPYARRYRQ